MSATSMAKSCGLSRQDAQLFRQFGKAIGDCITKLWHLQQVPAELVHWPTITKEMFGVWSTVRRTKRRTKHFVALSPFVLSMDHRNLLSSALSENEMVQHLAMCLQRYRFTMRHISGPTNVLCDYLSRAQYSSQTEIAWLHARAEDKASQNYLNSCLPISTDFRSGRDL